MSYKTRSARRVAKKSKHRFLTTAVFVIVLIYATFAWILPNFIGGIGFIKGMLNPSQKVTSSPTEEVTLAPPVLNIPFEATNTPEIEIKGYATPKSKVKIYIDDQLQETVDVSDNGEFTSPRIGLNLGSNNIYGKTVDEKEQESLPSKTIILIYDNEKPPLELSEPGDNIETGESKIKVSGKTEEGAQLFINESKTIVDQEGKFSYEHPLNEGENNLSIKAIDKATNTTEITRKVIYKKP